MPRAANLIAASVGLFTGAAFSPLISGSALVLLSFPPEAVREALLRYLSPSGIGIAKTTATTILAIGVVRWINRGLNTLAANNWRASAQPGWEWEKEIAVVTGGCNGIGLQIAKGLSQKGIKVAVLDVLAPPADFKGDDNIKYFQCDVTSSTSVAGASEGVRQNIGHPSILVNNAGIAVAGSILTVEEAALERIFRVNTMSHWTTVQQFVPHMISQNHGHVVTVASLASFLALPSGAAYSATKASALAFHEALTCELKNIQKAPSVITTVVHPNFVRTAMTAGFADRLEKEQGPLLTPEQVAGRVLKQIYDRKGAQVFIPERSWPASGLRAWPTWLQEVVRDGFGKADAKHKA
ncbi:dehydrogenase/reductase SDR family [Lophiotrema nucula]|uniref:Short-chain dehydrogenase/reductase 3 n=1 Tax=Lophiotrema nucula TaxID=690887 RepID=A0A6A5ZNT6_9PLEO|nr:dehydrogenase/reductase SDR family [Lophiotrema nucula]